MAKDPRSMTPKGRPGVGASTKGAPKKKNQANGAAPEGGGSKKPPKKLGAAKQAKMKRPPISASSRGNDNVPGVTSYKYGNNY